MKNRKKGAVFLLLGIILCSCGGTYTLLRPEADLSALSGSKSAGGASDTAVEAIRDQDRSSDVGMGDNAAAQSIAAFRDAAVSSDGATSPESAPQFIYVYVCGAVRNQGVYTLPSGSRIFEAIQAAGGLLEEADAKSLNQAGVLEDGQQLIVYTEEEIASGAAYGIAGGFPDTVISGKKDGTQGTVISGKEDGTPGTVISGKNDGSEGAAEGKTAVTIVNLNTADAAALMTLPGIGEARAAAVIAYREKNGPFTAAEDIMKIDGIKEKAYAKLKDYITV